MGAFPDEIGNFYDWLQNQNYGFGANDFVPRKLYGGYLRDVIENAVRNKPANAVFNLFDDEAVDIAIDDSQAQVILKLGDILFSNKVVLAFGNFLPPHPTVIDQNFISAPKYFQDPWAPKVYETIGQKDSVLIVGTGLSMVDLAMHYHEVSHKGKISAISTRGLLPASHRFGDPYPSFYEELKSQTLITGLLKTVRRHIDLAARQNLDWRGVVDSIRPVSQQIWIGLPMEEKRYFMQHLSRYWNVARHRMPPEAAGTLAEMQADGRLEILRGRLKKIDVVDEAFDISYHADGIESLITVNAVINCIGSESNFENLDAPLVKNLFRGGHIKNDALSLGIDALPDGRTIGGDGKISNVIYTLGTALKGVLWETTAIPEIRGQAKSLAVKLLSD